MMMMILLELRRGIEGMEVAVVGPLSLSSWVVRRRYRFLWQCSRRMDDVGIVEESRMQAQNRQGCGCGMALPGCFLLLLLQLVLEIEIALLLGLEQHLEVETKTEEQ